VGIICGDVLETLKGQKLLHCLDFGVGCWWLRTGDLKSALKKVPAEIRTLTHPSQRPESTTPLLV